MKTTKLLLLMFMFSLSSLADDEYSPRVVTIGEFSEFSTTVPLDVTKGECSETFGYGALGEKVHGSKLLTKVVFKGYNPGTEVQRHVKLWVNDMPGTLSHNILVFDGDCVIPSGGSADERIPLLSFDVDMPVKFSAYQMEIHMECTGEPADTPVYFEFDGALKRPVVSLTLPVKAETLSGSVKDQYGRPVSDAEVLVYRPGIHYSAVTDAEGHYDVRIGNGGAYYQMQVSAPGYGRYDIKNVFSATGKYLLTNTPVEDVVLSDRVEFTAGKLATIILPDAPDPSLGRYYRMDRVADATIFFEREEQPRANVPYVIFPDKDFSIDVAAYDQAALPVPGFVPAFPGRGEEQPFGFYGTYSSTDFDYFVMVLDDTPDCVADKAKIRRAGAFRCYFYGIGSLGTSFDKTKIVFVGEQTGIGGIAAKQGDAAPARYDLQGRRLSGVPQRGVYIEDGRKRVVR